MNKSIKLIAKNFIKTHSLVNPNFDKLKTIAQNIGYTIVEFNNIFNDKDVDTIIQNLKISDSILNSRGFTYADNNYRLIFINEDLNFEEKTIVLAHELGHIACEHFTKFPIIGKDVKEEHEANEFAHYILDEKFKNRIYTFVLRYKKIFIIALATMISIIVAIGIFAGIRQEQSYQENFYITSTGNKYHKKECIFVKDKTSVKRLTKEEFETDEYEACDMCLPDKE